MFPWAKFAIVGLRKAPFLHSICLHFEENITLEAVNMDLQPSGGEGKVSEPPPPTSPPATGLAGEVGVQSGRLGCMLQE